MRQTKYRLWDKFEKKWKDSYHYHLAPNGQLYYGGSNITEHNEIVFYTGLKDKNGKEIYEGDIVRLHVMTIYEKNHTVIYEIVFHNGRYKVGLLNDLHNVFGQAEVIGNIYEHSHLLEDKHE